MRDHRVDLNQLKRQPLTSNPLQSSYNSRQTQQYQVHSHLHSYLNGQLILDTPSTTHAIRPHHFAIKSIAQKDTSTVPKFNEQLIKTEQKYERINSNILTVRQIKQQQVKIRQRASSRASVNSSNNNRKLFVSISRSNSRLSEQRGMGSVQLGLEGKIAQQAKKWERREESSKKIKLTKYMEMRSGEKAAKNY